MDDRELRRAFRNAWILTIVAAVFIVLFALFTFRTNQVEAPERWDMGGTAFVPASAPSAQGYHLPVEEAP